MKHGVYAKAKHASRGHQDFSFLSNETEASERFLLSLCEGITLIIDPFHIVFWLGWSTMNLYIDEKTANTTALSIF